MKVRMRVRGESERHPSNNQRNPPSHPPPLQSHIPPTYGLHLTLLVLFLQCTRTRKAHSGVPEWGKRGEGGGGVISAKASGRFKPRPHHHHQSADKGPETMSPCFRCGKNRHTSLLTTQSQALTPQKKSLYTGEAKPQTELGTGTREGP